MPFMRDRASSLSLHAIARLFGEFRRYRLRVAGVVVLGLVISAIQPVSVKLSQRIIDELQNGIHPSFFRWVPAALLGIFLVSGIAKYFYMTTRRSVSERIL